MASALGCAKGATKVSILRPNGVANRSTSSNPLRSSRSLKQLGAGSHSESIGEFRERWSAATLCGPECVTPTLAGVCSKLWRTVMMQLWDIGTLGSQPIYSSYCAVLLSHITRTDGHLGRRPGLLGP